MSTAPATISIVVADDHEVVRTGFAALLDTQPDFSVVGTAADGAEAVRICLERRPDVVLMDVRMPIVDGIEATRRLGAAGISSRVLILTTFDLDHYVYDAHSRRGQRFPAEGRHRRAPLRRGTDHRGAATRCWRPPSPAG